MKNLQVINNAELITTPNKLKFQEYFLLAKLILHYAEFFCQEDIKNDNEIKY